MPRPLRSVEIFLALGAAAAMSTPWAAGAAAAAASASAAASLTTGQVPATGPAPLLAQHAAHSEGGEGGEGGEGAQEVASSDTAYLAVLGQMRGHLLVAQELMQQGSFAQAEKHIGHPVEELYGAVEPVLERRGVAPFQQSLTTLLELIQAAPRSAETRQAYGAAVKAIDAAMKGVPEQVRKDPRTTAAVAREIVRVAASEYDASMADGAIVEAIEYQDSRGFVLYARQLLAMGLSTGSGPEAVRILAPMQTKLEALARAWPSLSPPVKPVLSARTVTILANAL